MVRRLAAAVLVVVSVGCSAQSSSRDASTPSAHRTESPTAPAATTVAPSGSATKTGSVATAGTVTKTLVVFVENHTFAQMRTGMPYLNTLAQRYGYATGYTALTHPSLPNYLAVAAGSTFGISDDGSPAAHPLQGPSVFGQALAAGYAAKVYAEDMPANCYPSDSGPYAVRHTGWPYFADESAACRANQVPSGEVSSGAFVADAAAGRLPNVGWLIPNLCNDAHAAGCNDPNAGSLTLADDWLKTMLPAALNGPDFRSGRLAIVVTADEGNDTDNRVLTVVANAALSGKVVTSALNHYSLSGFLSAMSGSAPLRDAARAPSFAAAFGLTTP